MENFWLKRNKEKDRFRSRQYWGEIKNNYAPVALVWDSLYEEEMPILRENYMDIEQGFRIYLTESENAQRAYERGQVILKG